MKNEIKFRRLVCYKMLLTLVFSFLIIGDGYAIKQELDYSKTKISFQADGERLQDVLNRISKQADVRFFYSHADLNVEREITINSKDVLLNQLISDVLKEEKVNVDYQTNRTIVLKKDVVQQVWMRRVEGKVLDKKTNELLYGVSIVMKERPGSGVVTDLNGDFSIDVPEGITALQFSYVGYETELLSLVSLDQKDLTNIIISLVQTQTELQDVVVTGMAPRKRESFTGSYVTVKGEDLLKLSPNNLLQGLSFFDPSFTIVENNQRGSDPNALPEFQMRGSAQIGDFSSSEMNMLMGDYSNRTNTPLFILDGFEATLQRIVDLDPERVESITILKDASATAIYGSRAANGVVVFETKKPLPGALNISYSTNIGITMPDLTDYNMMNASEKLQFEFENGLFTHNTDGQPLGGSALADRMNYYNKFKREIDRGVDTYWLSAPLRTAFIHRHSLGISGGDEAFRYNVNVNYGDTPGLMKESGRKNVGLGLSLSYRRKKWNISNSLTIDDAKGDNTPYGSFSQYTKLNPYYTKTDSEGNLIKVLDEKMMSPGVGRMTVTNPLHNAQFPFKSFSNNFNVSNNLNVEYSLMENLRFTTQLSLTKGTGLGEEFRSMNHTDFTLTEDLTKRGSYSKNIGNSFSWNVNASVNYNLTKDKHLVSMLGRWEMRESTSDAVFFSALGFPNDNMTDFLFAYEMEDRVNGSENTTRSLGLIGTFSYMYDFRYSMDFTMRGDMSSQFGSDSGLKPFWSVGGRWNASREEWLSETAISNLVFRASYGITGSQNYDPYQSIETYTFENMMFPYLSSGVLGAEVLGIGNPNLGWSTTKDRSVAIDFGFWQERFNGSVNYYNNYTDELLLDNNIAPSTGFNTITKNIGAISNSGVDVNLSGVLYQDFSRQIQWRVGVNGAHNINKVEKISNEIKALNEENRNRRDAPLPIYEEGKSTSQLFVVPSLGIDPITGKEMFLKRDGSHTFTWDPLDKVSVGDIEPKLRGAINSSLTYKDWTANFAFSYQLGAYRYNGTLVDKIENINIGNNLDRRAAQDRWKEVGDISTYKKVTLGGHSTEASTRFVQKLNEIQFSTIAVGYRFQPKLFPILEKCNIAGMNVNATIEDIARLSTVKQERGLDYPFSRTFNLSVSILFN